MLGEEHSDRHHLQAHEGVGWRVEWILVCEHFAKGQSLTQARASGQGQCSPRHLPQLPPLPHTWSCRQAGSLHQPWTNISIRTPTHRIVAGGFLQEDFCRRIVAGGLLHEDCCRRIVAGGFLQEDFCRRIFAGGLLQEDCCTRIAAGCSLHLARWHQAPLHIAHNGMAAFCVQPPSPPISILPPYTPSYQF